MSMFKRLFGGSKDPAPAKPAPAPREPASAASTGPRVAPSQTTTAQINRMDDTIETMELREAMLEKKIEVETQKAKDAMAKKNKNLAMLCMKRKKLAEDNLSELTQQRANMEQLKFQMEKAKMNQEVLEAQRGAANEMERMNKAIDADRVEDDMDRLRDAMDDQARVGEMLGQPLGNDMVDEDDMMDELNEMMAEDKKAEKSAGAKAPAAKAPAAETLPDMGPSVPKTRLPDKTPATATSAAEDDEEEMLRQLQAELGA